MAAKDRSNASIVITRKGQGPSHNHKIGDTVKFTNHLCGDGFCCREEDGANAIVVGIEQEPIGDGEFVKHIVYYEDIE